jgi:hypothetical protein
MSLIKTFPRSVLQEEMTNLRPADWRPKLELQEGKTEGRLPAGGLRRGGVNKTPT